MTALATTRLGADIEYLVRAHQHPDGWTITVDPVHLIIDSDGYLITAEVLHHHAIGIDVPTTRSWSDQVMDHALHGAGYDRVEPWDVRHRDGQILAWTQVLDTTPARILEHATDATSSWQLAS